MESSVVDLNTTLRDAEFKDDHPLKTVARIKDLLHSLGIETEEVWFNTGVPYCYGLSVFVAGTTFSVNGKGLTKEFALASGYGELMERLQLGYISKFNTQKSGDHSVDTGKETSVSASALLAENLHWYELMSKRAEEDAGIRVSPESILRQAADSNGNVAVESYFNLTTGETTVFPKKLRSRIYSSNGCAAGNSMEEALVQALSEVVERHYRGRIMREDLSLPDIPDDFLKQYQTAYEIISYVRSQGFQVTVKDCSLGEKFPVVCACFVDEKTGRYHTHFGAYPVFEIALARALTETFQGRHIDSIASFETFSPRGSDSPLAIQQEFVKGAWEKPACFFVGQPKYPFNPTVGFSGKNNRELLLECVDFLRNQGYEILVHDGSCLGFHTYQVIIPGYSEIFAYRLSESFFEFQYADYARKALRNPSGADFEDLLGLLMHMEQLQTKFSTNHTFLSATKLSAKLEPAEEANLMSASLGYVYYTLGKYREATKCVHQMITSGQCSDTGYLICLKRYLMMSQSGADNKEIRDVLSYFHPAQVVERLYSCIESGANPLEDYTLHCDLSCSEDCKICSVCSQKRVAELTKLIQKKTAELNFDLFAKNLSSLIHA